MVDGLVQAHHGCRCLYFIACKNVSLIFQCIIKFGFRPGGSTEDFCPGLDSSLSWLYGLKFVCLIYQKLLLNSMLVPSVSCLSASYLPFMVRQRLISAHILVLFNISSSSVSLILMEYSVTYLVSVT